MCGIVGAASHRNVVPLLLEGLRKLEYRGYDSAGLAVINGGLHRLRSVGRVSALTELAQEAKLTGTLGIAHTRWATHGAPTERNAHPHVSRDGLAIVHNGIIENHESIRAQLSSQGYRFESDTDTEVVAHLIHHHLQQSGDLLEATHRAVTQLAGAYAIAVVSASKPDRVTVARVGAPLLLGLGEGENFAASDASALLQVTRKIVYLEEGDVAEITPHGWRVLDAHGAPAQRDVHESNLSADAVELGPYRHYMQKEIFEQPGAVAATLEMVTGAQSIVPQLVPEDLFRHAVTWNSGSPASVEVPYHGRRQATTMSIAARPASRRAPPSGRRCIVIRGSCRPPAGGPRRTAGSGSTRRSRARSRRRTGPGS